MATTEVLLLMIPITSNIAITIDITIIIDITSNIAITIDITSIIDITIIIIIIVSYCWYSSSSELRASSSGVAADGLAFL